MTLKIRFLFLMTVYVNENVKFIFSWFMRAWSLRKEFYCFACLFTWALVLETCGFWWESNEVFPCAHSIIFFFIFLVNLCFSSSYDVGRHAASVYNDACSYMSVGFITDVEQGHGNSYCPHSELNSFLFYSALLYVHAQHSKNVYQKIILLPEVKQKRENILFLFIVLCLMNRNIVSCFHRALVYVLILDSLMKMSCQNNSFNTVVNKWKMN